MSGGRGWCGGGANGHDVCLKFSPIPSFLSTPSPTSRFKPNAILFRLVLRTPRTHSYRPNLLAYRFIYGKFDLKSKQE